MGSAMEIFNTKFAPMFILLRDYKVVNENTKACKSVPNNYEV